MLRVFARLCDDFKWQCKRNFSFEGDKNPHSPLNHIENCIVYTGTHDNMTTEGFYKSLSPKKRREYSKKLPCEYKRFSDKVIAYAMSSVAKTVIIPIQDYMHLSDEARINAPATTENNWSWILPKRYRRKSLIERIRKFSEESSRQRNE